MRPSIVFYFVDQQRWDTVGAYGQRLPVTPSLDEIAREGTLFENAFTCQPVCGPARACLQSGKWATETGCFRNAVPLPLDIRTLADCFHEAGYDTAYVGKWHLASGDGEGAPHYETSAVPPERRGGWRDYWMASDVLEFTSHGYNGFVFDGEGQRHDFVGYRADAINNYAIDYLHSRASGRPFILFISQIEPHHQNDHGVFEGPDGSKERFRDFDVPGDLAGTAGDWRENYPDYLGQCRSLDDNVGRLRDTLKETGYWDDTVFFYVSDHGCHFKTRNGEYKRSCHDSCIHIPLIAHGPGFSGGKRIPDLVSLMDLPATLLDIAGIEKPADFAGDSLKRLVSGDASGWKKDVFLQISESEVGRAVRTGKWKYSVRADGDGWNDPFAPVYYEEYLYDLVSDPHERNNLVADPSLSDVRKELAELLLRRMAEAHEPPARILPAKA
ncbi:MAG: sulfatase-like hydrolase/transferase [Clostridia bacterium]|nr:sulfatase-like hydrolase/transferase [Clostridia bacterium]